MKLEIKGMTENVKILDADIPEGEAELLKNELERVNTNIAAAISNFNYAEAQEMIDYYTYFIKANEILYNYLNKKYREMNNSERVVLDGIS